MSNSGRYKPAQEDYDSLESLLRRRREAIDKGDTRNVEIIEGELRAKREDLARERQKGHKRYRPLFG